MRYWRGRIPLFQNWQVLLAIMAMGSLPMLLPVANQPQEITDLGPWLRMAERHRGYGNHGRVKAVADFLLDRAPGASRNADVQFLRAEAVVGLAGEGKEPAGSIAHALEAAIKFRSGREPEYEALVLRAAAVFSAHGHHDETVDLYRSLEASPREAVRLQALRALPLEYALFPKPRDEAWALMTKYEPELSRHDRIGTLKLKAQVLDLLGRYPESIAVLTELEPSFRRSALYIQRGRVYKKLKDWENARKDLERARDLLREEKGVAAGEAGGILYALLEVYRELDRKECETLAQQMIRDHSPLTPLARLSWGEYDLLRNPERAMETLRTGLEVPELGSLLRLHGFDLAGLRTRLRAMWFREKDERLLVSADGLLELMSGRVAESADLFADRDEAMEFVNRVTEDRADLHQKLALQYQKEAGLQAGANDQESRKYMQKAQKFFHHAAWLYARLAQIPDLKPVRQIAAYRSAAEMFYEGGQYVQAARHYQILSTMVEKERPEVLLKQASALKHARIYEVPDREVPDAMKVLNTCMTDYRPEDPVYREALLEKGRILMDLSRYEESASEFRKILEDEKGVFGLTPEAKEFKEALFHYGLARFHQVRRQGPAAYPEQHVRIDAAQRALFEEARAAFLTFLERYSVDLPSGEAPHRYCMRATYYAAVMAMMEGQWALAMDYFDKTLSLGRPYLLILTPEEKNSVKQSAFYRADMMYRLGNYTGAAQAYDAVTKKYPTDRERIWAMIGHGRSLLKLGKKIEAERIFQEVRSRVQEDAAQGIARESEVAVWMQALAELSKP